MTTALTRHDLMTLEQYAEKRNSFRKQVIAHKKNRKLPIGDNATLYFEDKLTIQYQIQEMLRIEKIFEAAGIQEELDAYNPLIPDGQNWKATFMLEYADAELRRQMTRQLLGIEDKVWFQVSGFEKVLAIANEDLERTDGEKTSAVHFMRFELTHDMIGALKQGAELTFGIDHEKYKISTHATPELKVNLIADLD